MKKRTIRMRKFVLVHALDGQKCLAPSRGNGIKVTSKRPKRPKRAPRCSNDYPTLWRRAERVNA